MTKPSEIFRYRWPEIIMLTGLHAALVCFVRIYLNVDNVSAENANNLSSAAYFFIAFGTAAIGVILQMLLLGFLRSAWTHGQQPFEPTQLIKIGREFFWRFLLFQVIIGIMIVFVNSILVTTTASITGITTENIPEKMPLLYQMCGFAAVIILLKPTVMIPALIIADNCTPLQALRNMANYKIMQKFNFVVFVTICFAISFVLSAMISKTSQTTMYYYAIVIQAIVSALATTIIVPLATLHLISTHPLQKNNCPDHIKEHEIL